MPKHEKLDQKNVVLKYHLDDEVKPPADRPRRMLEVMAEVLEHTNYGPVLDHMSRVVGHCNRCSVACPIYQSTHDPKDIPCHRTDLLVKIYKRYFTASGRTKGRLFGGWELTDAHVDEMIESFWRCNACRKCNRECPFHLDHGLITHFARWILSEMGIQPRALAVSMRAQLEGPAKNTSNIPLPALIDTIEFLEEELEEKVERKIKFPIDQKGAEYLFVVPVSDYIMEADTLMGNAAVLHAGGVSWTIGSENADAINYGLFYNDRNLEEILLRLVAEAKRLHVKKILIGECGHASRAAKAFMESLGGPDRVPVVNCVELAHQLWKEGKIKLDPTKITERCTYHDPCNIARMKWIVEQPRELIRAFIPNFVEMSHGGTDNYCCGGGGGLVSMDETAEYRMEVSGRRKAVQVKETGAEILIAPCANCKKQLGELMTHHQTGARVEGLHNLLLEALILPPDEQPADEGGEG